MLDGTANRPGAVFVLLRSIYVDDDRFQGRLRTVDRRHPGPARHDREVTCSLGSRRTRGERAVDPETDPATMEHVLPENPAGEWSEAFPPDRWDAAVDRLGNLTLLERTLNRNLGNASYPAKRAAYESSGYALTREIADLAPEDMDAGPAGGAPAAARSPRGYACGGRTSR